MEGMSDKEKRYNAIMLMFQYGQISGQRHKGWVIYQLARILCGYGY